MTLDERLRSELRAVPSPSVDEDDVLQHVHTAQRRHESRRFALGSLIMVVVLVAAVGGVVAIQHRPTNAKVSSVSVNVGVPTRRIAPAATAVTDEQLRAHDGVDVPAGWVPVDYRNARLWVPRDWTYNEASCPDATAGSRVQLGTVANDCSHVPAAGPDLFIEASTRAESGPPTRVVHGYRLYVDPRTGLQTSVGYIVPQLGVEIIFERAVDMQILDTLAPSSRVVAATTATNAPPSEWKPVSSDGVSFALPATWKFTTAHFLCGGLNPASAAPYVERITATVGYAPCPFIPPTVDRQIKAGGFLYTADAKNVPTRSGSPIATLQNGTTRTTIYADPDDADVVDLFIQRTGSPTIHVMTLGLGRDGRVTGGILASLQADS